MTLSSDKIAGPFYLSAAGLYVRSYRGIQIAACISRESARKTGLLSIFDRALRLDFRLLTVPRDPLTIFGIVVARPCLCIAIRGGFHVYRRWKHILTYLERIHNSLTATNYGPWDCSFCSCTKLAVINAWNLP